MNNDVGLAAFVMFQQVIMDVMEDVQKRNSIDAATMKRLEQEWVQNLLRGASTEEPATSPDRDPVYALRSDCWRLASELRRRNDPNYTTIQQSLGSTGVEIRPTLASSTTINTRLQYHALESWNLTPQGPGAPVVLSATGATAPQLTSTSPLAPSSAAPAWKGFGSSSTTTQLAPSPAASTAASVETSNVGTIPTSGLADDGPSLLASLMPADDSADGPTTFGGESGSTTDVSTENKAHFTTGHLATLVPSSGTDSTHKVKTEVEWEEEEEEEEEEGEASGEHVTKRVRLQSSSADGEIDTAARLSSTTDYIEQIRTLQQQEKRFNSVAPTLPPTTSATYVGRTEEERLEDEELDSQDEDESEVKRRQNREQGITEDECICFYEEVKKPRGKGRKKNVWTVKLTQGLLRIGPLDYVFHRVNGELYW